MDPFWSTSPPILVFFRVNIRSSLVRIDGSLFLHPKMSETDGKFVQKKVKNGTPKICPKIDAKCMIFSRMEMSRIWTPFCRRALAFSCFLGSMFGPPWFGSTGLFFCTLKCQTSNKTTTDTSGIGPEGAPLETARRSPPPEQAGRGRIRVIKLIAWKKTESRKRSPIRANFWNAH